MAVTSVKKKTTIAVETTVAAHAVARLVPDLRAITARVVSKTASDCDLHLTPMDLSRYTSVFRLTYEFGDPAACVRDPDLEVCVYHDARLAEVRSFRGFQRHPQLSRLHSGLKRELDQRWSRNMMLNKWLEYCAERGHHF